MKKLLSVLVILFFSVSISAQEYVQVWGDEFTGLYIVKIVSGKYSFSDKLLIRK